MASHSYVPRNTTLLLLCNAAEERLAAGEDVSSLSDARLAAATEEINRIADDMRRSRADAHLNNAETENAALGQ